MPNVILFAASKSDVANSITTANVSKFIFGPVVFLVINSFVRLVQDFNAKIAKPDLCE
jgi:hypothetical protein